MISLVIPLTLQITKKEKSMSMNVVSRRYFVQKLSLPSKYIELFGA